MDTESYKPPGLSGHAEQLWNDVTGSYELRYDDLIVLGNACKEISLIDEIMAAQESRAMVSLGSMGQEIADPTITELRQHRGILRQLLAQLKLPDEGGARKTETPEEVSEKNRANANKRWERVRNAG